MITALSSWVQAADSLEKMAQMVGKRMKNENAKKLAVLSFAYEDERASSGPAVIIENLSKILARDSSVQLIARKLIEEAVGKMQIEKGRKIDEKTGREIGKNLEADAVLTGSLSDIRSRSVKKQTGVQTVLTHVATGRPIGTGRAAVNKTWKDSFSVGCGPLQYVNRSTTSYQPQISPKNIQVVFADPWWPSQKIGSITWNFCKPGKKIPTLNDALNDLKKKVWQAGGRTLLIRKNDPSPENPQVLRIEAEVFY